MIWQQDIQDAIFKHIAEQMKCSVDELHSGETNFIMDETVSKRYVKILSVGDTNVVTVSKNIYSEAMRCLRGKNRDELYESDFVFGQTLHYVPDLSQMTILPFTNDFTFELLVRMKFKNCEEYMVSIIHYHLTKMVILRHVLFYMQREMTKLLH